MGYLALPKSTALHGIEASEWLLLFFGALVIVGITGEIRLSQFSPRLKLFEYLVLWGIVGELVADGGVFVFSTQLQTISDHEVATAQQKANDADKEAKQLQKDAEGLKKAAEDERLARIKIEEAVAWRSLTNEGQAEMGSALRRFRGEPALVQYDANDIEEGMFGSDIASALHIAEWRISEPLAMLRLREGPVPFGTNPPLETGIAVTSTRDLASHNAADAVVRELRSRGFDCVRSTNDDRRATPAVFIILEHRPQGAQGAAKIRQNKR